MGVGRSENLGPGESPRETRSRDETSIHTERAIQGDRKSLDWLVERFTPTLRAWARARARRLLASDPSRLDDIVQETWVRVLPKLSELKPRNDRYGPVLIKFATTVLKNLILSSIERPAREQATELLDLTSRGESSAGTRLARREEADLLYHVLQKLEPRKRQVVLLFGLEQRSQKEVARRLGIEPGHVGVLYSRARKELKYHLFRSIAADEPASGKDLLEFL